MSQRHTGSPLLLVLVLLVLVLLVLVLLIKDKNSLASKFLIPLPHMLVCVTLRHRHELLGTKGQHPRSCFRRTETGRGMGFLMYLFKNDFLPGYLFVVVTIE